MRTWHAISASAAKISGKFGAVFFNGFKKFAFHFRGIFKESKEFFKFGHALDSPYRKNVVELAHPCKSGGRIIDKSACKGFHSNISHVFFFTFFNKGKFLFAGKIAERELESFIQSGSNSLLCHGQTVVGNADMADFAAFNEVYGKYFTSKPARSCVAVKELPKDVLVEIETITELA